MKKNFLCILALLLSFNQLGFAQDDDIYFVPSKSSKADKQHKTRNAEPEFDYNYEEDAFSYDNWADNRQQNQRDVDEYNRRGKEKFGQSTSSSPNQREEATMQETSCTERIVRFHSPSVGVYVSSPYYSDYIDIWYDPWFFDPWYDSFGYYGYSRYGWYSWHHHYYWNNPWYCYDPWYNPWGPCYGWYDPYYRPSYRPVAPAGAHYGPHGGYVYYGNKNNSGNRYFNSNNRYNNRYQQSERPSREYGNRYHNERPSRNYGNSSDRRPSRDFGNQNSSRPSRTFGNSGNERPSRDFSGSSHSSERNFNSAPTRMRNNSGSLGGSGRSFGHSRGGRR